MPKRRSHNPDSSIQQVHKANIHQPNRSSKFACLGPTFKCQIWIVQRLKFLISKMHNCKIWILTSLVHVHVAELNAKKIMSFQRPNVKAHNLEYTFQCLRIVSLVLHIMSKLISNVAKGLRLKPLYPMSQVLCPLSNFGSANMFQKIRVPHFARLQVHMMQSRKFKGVGWHSMLNSSKISQPKPIVPSKHSRAKVSRLI